MNGRHVLFILLGFFGAVLAANGVFLYIALSTLPGEESGATYEAGLRYNATLAGARAQDRLHWSHKAEILPGSKIAVTMRNAGGTPVAGLAIAGTLERPATDGGEQSLIFKEVDTGRYEAAVEGAQPGAWILAVTAQKPRPGSEVAIYRVKERIWIATPR
ncbi:MAG: FixH family protein [Rhodomicrobium sp.]|nr:FixH family protein [Rhodomicrobium sp.]